MNFGFEFVAVERNQFRMGTGEAGLHKSTLNFGQNEIPAWPLYVDLKVLCIA